MEMVKIEEFVVAYAQDRSDTNCLKWNEIKKYDVENLLPIWIADAEFKTAPEITAAMKETADFGVFGYIKNPDSYAESFIDWQKRYGYNVKKEWLSYSTGVLNLIIYGLKTLIKPQDEVLLLTPVYPPFNQCIEAAEGRSVHFDLTNEQGHYYIDFEKLEELLKKSNIKVLIHCNPHNPIGRVWTIEEQNQLVHLMKKYNVMIISDEIHQDLTFKDFNVTALALEGSYSKHIITINSNSKTFSIAGCSIAQAIIEDQGLKESFDLVAVKNSHAPRPLMHFVASEAGYRSNEAWLNGFKALIQSNFNYLCDQFEGSDVFISPLEGTYLAWLDFNQVIDVKELENKMIYEAKVLPNFGEAFGKAGCGFIRLNLAITPDTLKDAISRIKTLL